MLLAAPLLCAACGSLDIDIPVLESDQVVAEVAAIVAVDPTDPASGTLHMSAIITRYADGWTPQRVPGASVVVRGESGRAVRLAEQDDQVAGCVNPNRPARLAGTCYLTVSDPGAFGLGEALSMTATLPDGSQLVGSSRIPGAFVATDLALDGGSCRLAPRTNHRFAWNPVEGAVAFVAEVAVHRLAALGLEDGTLSWDTHFVGGERTGVAFPRELLLELDLEAARELRDGLPAGASADIALGAVDLNWANWIRRGRINLSGEVRVPSVFGDGTGWFGSAVRWRLSVQSREGGGVGNLPLCGPAPDGALGAAKM